MTGRVPTPDRAAARAAKERVRELVLGDQRVNGVGLTFWGSTYAVRVNVVDDSDLPDLPDAVDGVPVRVVAVGRIRSQEQRQQPGAEES